MGSGQCANAHRNQALSRGSSQHRFVGCSSMVPPRDLLACFLVRASVNAEGFVLEPVADTVGARCKLITKDGLVHSTHASPAVTARSWVVRRRTEAARLSSGCAGQTSAVIAGQPIENQINGDIMEVCVTRVQGSCKCGAVSYSVSSAPLNIINCHCTMCRSMSGHAFASYVVVRDVDCVTDGTEGLTEYAVTERATKHFCSRCGTAVFNTNPSTYPGVLILYLGTVKGHEQLRPQANIFSDSMLPWVEQLATIKSFSGAPRAGT